MYSCYLKALLKKQSLRLSLCSSHLPLHKGGVGAVLVCTYGNTVGAERLDAPTDTVIAVARLRKCGGKHQTRASNARPYILVGSTGYVVGATIGRPLLRLSRQGVTVIPHLTTLSMSAAHCPSRRASAFPLRSLRGRWVGFSRAG